MDVSRNLNYKGNSVILWTCNGGDKSEIYDYIYNNYNDCRENNCVIRSVTKLVHHVNSKGNISDFDVNYTHGYVFPEVKETIKGLYHILLISGMYYLFNSMIMSVGKIH